MRRIPISILALSLTLVAVLATVPNAKADDEASHRDVLPRIDERYTAAQDDQTPDFQRHVMPLLGRLGCNGRACHGSFQGQGGFQLSLFGYDFKADHEALHDNESPRVDTEKPDESLIIYKPTHADEDEHGGGQRYKKGSWQYHVIHRWIEGGAKFEDTEPQKLTRLDVTPREIVFHGKGEQIQLRAVAVWADGTREDVTPLCRFKTNNGQVAKIDADGILTSNDPGDTHVVVFYDNGVVPIPVMRPVSDQVGEKYPDVASPTRIDELVVEKLRKLGIVPSELADDAMFLRRISIDLTGTLPAPEAVEAFLADESPDKRARKIDELLESPAYAAWWTTRLCDFTGNNDEALNNVTPLRGRASQDWYDWVHKRVEDNAPYDELVAGIVLAKSRQEGESYTDYCRRMSETYRDGAEFCDQESMPYYWARREFRKPEERAIGFAYTFMGLRIQCAQCHKHPFDQWSKQDFEQFSQFFTRVVASNGPSRDARDEYNKMIEDLGLKGKRGGDLRRAIPDLIKQGKTVPFPELVVVGPRNTPNKKQPNNKKPPREGVPADSAKLLGAETVNLNEHADARVPLLEWLRREDNPYFARAFVNRVWASYFNVGIVEPPDDLSLANPPSNGPLLDYLTAEFIEQGYDMKWLHRTIAMSHTYQRSWTPNDTNRLDEVNFSRAVPRRLPAEVAYDAVTQATGSDEVAARMSREMDGRAIAIPGAGNRYQNRGASGYALTIFGRSTRDSNCDCDRSSDPNLLQTVFLQNDSDMLGMIDRKDGWIAQVARETGLSHRPQASSKLPKRPANYDKYVEQMTSRMKQLKSDGKKDQAKQMARRIDAFKKRFAAPQRTARKDEGQPEDASLDVEQLVRRAYLRTLNRLPTADELSSSRSYVTGSDDPITGVRDLLWALVNTKEFIVNH